MIRMDGSTRQMWVKFNIIISFCAPFPFGVLGKMWVSSVAVTDHCIFILLAESCVLQRKPF